MNDQDARFAASVDALRRNDFATLQAIANRDVWVGRVIARRLIELGHTPTYHVEGWHGAPVTASGIPPTSSPLRLLINDMRYRREIWFEREKGRVFYVGLSNFIPLSWVRGRFLVDCVRHAAEAFSPAMPSSAPCALANVPMFFEIVDAVERKFDNPTVLASLLDLAVHLPAVPLPRPFRPDTPSGNRLAARRNALLRSAVHLCKPDPTRLKPLHCLASCAYAVCGSVDYGNAEGAWQGERLLHYLLGRESWLDRGEVQP